MKVLKSKDGQEEIHNFSEWEDFMVNELNKGGDWKPGYSAYTLAEHIFPKDQTNTTPQTALVRAILAQVLGVQESAISLEEAVPECKIKFDSHKHQREHDLAIWGSIKSPDGEKPLFIGIESKVDETFGPLIGKYIEQRKKKSHNTKIEERISGLTQKLGIGRDLTKVNDLYYQLLYMIAGCLPYRENRVPYRENRVPYRENRVPTDGEHVALILNFSTKQKSINRSKAAIRDLLKKINGESPDLQEVSINHDGKTTTLLSCDVKFGEFCVRTVLAMLNPS